MSYCMLLQYMCEVSKLLTISNPSKSSLKKVEKEVKHGLPYATRKLNDVFRHIINKYFLLFASNFFVSCLIAVSHFILQNLEAIDHPVPEI